MLVWLARAVELVSRAIYLLIEQGLKRWHLILVVMLCFALNRYAVATIDSQKRELMARSLLIEADKRKMQEKIERLRAQIHDFDKPAWQEMVIMRDLLLFPENCDVYWFSSSQEKQQEEGETL